MTDTSINGKKSASAACPVQMRETECLLCGGGDDRLMFPSNVSSDSFTAYTFSARRASKLCRYNVWRCGKCGLVRSSPVLTEEAAGELYRQSLFIWEGEADHASRTYIELLEKLCPGARGSGARVLEIGSGNGGFIAELARHGWKDPLGVEPSADCTSKAPDEAKPFLMCDLFRPGMFPPESFDIAASFHVIDHLHNPLEVIRECVRILRPGGKLLLVCHDVSAPSARILGRLSPIFDIEHIYLFDVKTLGGLMQKAGLEPVASGSLVNTYPLEYWMRMFPGVKHLRGLLPRGLAARPVSLAAGNLYIMGEKKG